MTADPGVNEVYLGRPWRDYARTVFIETEMGAHIVPEGWSNWSRPEAEETVFYAEYNSSVDIENRVAWLHQLTEEQVQAYTLEKIFDGWTPLGD